MDRALQPKAGPGAALGGPGSHSTLAGQRPYHCLVMSNIMTTPLQFLYTSRNSASRAISDSACGCGTEPQRWAMTHMCTPASWRRLNTSFKLKQHYLFLFLGEKKVNARLTGMATRSLPVGEGPALPAGSVLSAGLTEAPPWRLVSPTASQT